MKKIPRKIKLGANEIKVLNLPKNDKSCYGLYEYESNVIRIRKHNVHSDIVGVTLTHEILEAINDKYDMKLSHMKISVLGEVLYQVLKDNDIRFYKRTRKKK